MRSERFWNGDKVMTLTEHESIPIGTGGTIASRWLGTVYAVRLSDGAFHWMDSSELASIDPSRHDIQAGDIAVVTSEKHKHKFVGKGDFVQVVKTIEDADYYEVILNDELHWLNGFELARFM